MSNTFASRSQARKPTSSSDIPPIVREVVQSPGQPLDATTRAFMEPHFAHDFSHVRIHTDAKASESAQSVEARAYTFGSHIVFGDQQYAPDIPSGMRLMAHELTHVTQQQSAGGAPILAREAARGERPPGEVEAEERAQWYPEFPGCGPWQRRRLDFQLMRASTLVLGAIAGLQEELTPSPSGIITLAGSALENQFHTRRPEHIRTIVARLEGIHTMLERGENNIHCVTASGCTRHCSDSTATACAGPTAPIRVCPPHFEHGDLEGSLTLIHEAGHQSGRGMAGGPGHYYRTDARFVNLTTTQAMNNPDSYVLFVRDLYYGGPIVRSRPAGAVPEAPHEREARSIAESRVWAPSDLSMYLSVEQPSIAANIGWQEGKMLPVPTASHQVGNRFKGTIEFFPDSVGRERRRPYPTPAVSARMTLQRSSGRPARSVLLNVSDDRARDAGNGSALQTTFSRDFDFSFGPSDRGTLQVEMRMQDFDTATTIVFRDHFIIRP